MLFAFFAFAVRAQEGNVTISVDMSQQDVSPNGVHVAGDFQAAAGYDGDWNPGSTELLPVGDGIYSVTLNLPPGQYEYKFINGNEWGDDEGVPSVNQRGGGNSNRVFAFTDWHQSVELPAVLFGGSASAGNVAVRLEVDMAAVGEISDNGVHVAGTLLDPEWTPQYGTMFSSTASKYAYVADVNPNNTYLYKFLNGDDWGQDEWSGTDSPSECTTDGNRSVTVGDESMAVDAVCYEGCSTCAPLTEVTLRVNMSLEDNVNPDAVSVAGSFQGWAPGATLLTHVGDNIYEVVLNLEQGSYEYKFINGTSWGTDEQVPGECNVNGNRGLEVGEDPVVIEVCFNQCTTECVADPDPSDITFRVNMENETVSEDGVWVMGNFTSPQWQSGAIQMFDTNGDGIYEITVENVSGPAEVAYKFANGDPNSNEEDGNFIAGGCGISNGLGGYNRVLTRTDEDVILDVVCYNACVNCNEVGLEEKIADEVKIYPNPTNGSTFVKIDNFGQNKLTVSIIDITGKIVRENIILNGTITEINTRNLNAGLYFLNILNENGVQSVHKLIVR